MLNSATATVSGRLRSTARVYARVPTACGRPALAESGMLERMLELGILYDASGGGELLHFSTAMTGTSLFLEVLERRGGYDGYGAPNSPVMIAAQRRERTRA
jgi:4-hydroxyphenylpyruvate dioxygenase-like putative hemolysin